jgi:hypothetical protein
MTTPDYSIYKDLYTIKANGTIFNMRGRELASKRVPTQLRSVCLTDKEGNTQKIYLHRLVYYFHNAITPMSIPERVMIVQRDRSDLSNCSITNLKAITAKERTYSQINHNPQRKLNYDNYVTISESYDKGMSLSNIAMTFAVTVSTIQRVLGGRVMGYDGNLAYKEVLAAHAKIKELRGK